ncbi:MAG: thymidine kinase [Myxococcaceae bacterium]|nr:thymidine kinase [Myxococcaceae bacterium]MBH2006120.1 thymidine kinase [Myxococcaceae bacterium]
MRQLNTGVIEVICGPMFSGKTEELIRRLRRAEIAKQRILVFKPKIDIRFDEIQIVSHSAQKIPSIPIETPDDMVQYLEQLQSPIDLIGIDEAQFFDHSLIPLVEQFANSGIRVILSGLDQDSDGCPFGPMPNLLAIADLVTKQCAVCVVCGASATKSFRLKDRSTSQVFVGANDSYEARCRCCYHKGNA